MAKWVTWRGCLFVLLACVMGAEEAPKSTGSGHGDPAVETPVAGVPAPTADQASCPAVTGKDYSGQDLEDHNFSAEPAGSLKGANFKGANLKGAVFADQDLSGASFERADLGPSDKGPADFTGANLYHTCFIGAVMNATMLGQAKLHCTNFTDTSLLQADFGPLQDMVADPACRTLFVRATLDVDLITDPAKFGGRSNWGKSDFSDANFQGVSPARVNFRGKDLSHAVLSGTDFTSIDFTGANLTQVEFHSAQLSQADFSNTAINGADFSRATLTGAKLICAQGYGNSGGTRKADGSPCPKVPHSAAASNPVRFLNATMDNADLTGATLTLAVLSGATLTRSVFRNADLGQADFQSRTDASAALVKFGLFDGADLSQARVSSVDFSGCSLLQANFENTTFNSTNFTAARLDQAVFTKANLQATNFSAASLKSARFAGATISQPSSGGSNMDFTCAQLGGADLSNADVKAGFFNNAVMVAGKFCCPPKQPNAPLYCGIIDSLGVAYAETKFPDVSGPAVRCPDGAIARTTSSGQKPELLCPDLWRLSPSWTTTGCSRSGQQTMWSINCSGKPGDVVKFADPKLKECILEKLPGQTEVLVSTAQQIETVDCPDRGITEIGGLEEFISMHTLDLSGNQLSSFDLKLKKVQPDDTQLVTLNLDHNSLKTLDLTGISSIEFLNVANNQLTGLALNANTYLESLQAQSNRLRSVNLPIQTDLFYVDLSSNQLTDVLNPYATDLGALQSLVFLDLSDNALTTIGSVKSLTYDDQDGQGKLRKLYLSCNPDFKCGDLDVYDGTRYPAASSSGCSVYDAKQAKWIPQATPTCH